MVAVVEALVDSMVANLSGIDADQLRASGDSYVQQLQDLHSEVQEMFEAVPASKRVLVTNHEVFNYFAKQYDFKVVGTVIPSLSTTDSASAKQLTELMEVIETNNVPAIFADVASSDKLAAMIAEELGDISVVNLYSESLGEAGSGASTYLDMLRTTYEQIATALASDGHDDDHDHDH